MANTVVLDTNVVLDLWHFEDAGTRELRRLIETRALHVVTSAALDDELHDVLSRAAFLPSRSLVLERWRTLAATVDVPAAAPWQCRDPDDQKLLDLAVSAVAAALITKDKALLALARQAAEAKLLIATPQRFVFATAAATAATAAA
jgi:uncharacterized protein